MKIGALLGFYGLMGLVALCLYGMDKGRAVRHRRRIRESVLLGFGFFGGAVGALIGMQLFRHKTRHWYFWAINLAGLLWQILLLFFCDRLFS